ncbi:MAG: M23 family metallopeptidase [Deltaproteobacteria bacterium]|uniref:M23 family metallopeptidase n=1 Tax=Candidatus Zymogenus saltonus TaxID=2844893 RepID=A0A9D8KIR9_9DELT|nr:M23 family metallopeptidase [Candidatus Zymogenus saltonus]
MRRRLFIQLFFITIPEVLYAQDWGFLGEWSEAVDRDAEVREIINANIASIRSLAEDEFIDRVPSIWPCPGRITSGFGYRIHPRHGCLKFHAGVDIANRIGTPVVATGGGRVMYTGWHDDLGLYVKVRHTDRLVTKYGHLDKILVKIGDEVVRGDRIGTVGTTGWVTGPHTHYEILIDGVNVNPVEWMER